jgi:putative ABC transport system permease protein
MIKSFIKIAMRFLWRNKSYTILNFFCLTFGLTCAIIASLYVLDLFGHDRFHKNYNRLYEVEALVTYFNGDRFAKEPLSASLNDVLSRNVPEIESLARIVSRSYTLINGDKSFTENGIYSDDAFFEMFTFPLFAGDGKRVLSETNSIVVSERTAQKLYGSADCLGRTIILKEGENRDIYKITGVLKNIPSQSLLQFDFVLPISKFLSANGWANETGASSCRIWALVSNTADISKVNSKIKDLIKHLETTLDQELFLFPLKEKILYTYSGARRVWKGMNKVVIVGSIGIAILIIACFNFINLATALNIRRYREVGIKKVAGAKRSEIIMQFLGETFIILLISLIFAIIFARLLISGFNTMFNGEIHLNYTEFKVILDFALIALSTELFSGLLPALFLSSFNPVTVLNAKIITSHSYSLFRQSLIVIQFAIPIVLIICMMIIKVQGKYMRDFDLGFDKDKLVILNSTKNLEDHEESLKTDLLSIPGVEAVSFANCIPSRGAPVTNEVAWEGKDVSEKLHFWTINTDFNYEKTVKIKMTEGRYFDKTFISDSACYVINDVAANIMKSNNPLGRQLTLEGRTGTIIGVFKDFHTIDLAGPVVPTIISLNGRSRSTLLIRFSAGSFGQISEKIGSVYKRYESGIPFQPVLLSDLPDFSGLRTTSNLVGLAFFIALLLACLGLWGFASCTAEKRTREIGIRKINGATVFSIMQLLLKNYTRWLAIAFVIALPLSYIIGNMFLSRFFFRTPMPLWTFVVGPILSYMVAMLSVSLQSWRAATRNPLEALCYE